MNIFVKIILIIFSLAYFISPIDLIPDFLIPYLGWVDDTFIIGIVLYLLRFGRLPYFSGKKGRIFNNFSNLFNSYKNKSANSNQEGQYTNKNINKDPYEILGIKNNATKKEIQTAYKLKVKLYHPDKVSHLGEELQKVANEKFIEIKNAYDFLMK